MRKALTVMALSGLVTTSAAAQAGKPVYGAASPQEIVAAMRKVNDSGDFISAVPYIAPASRRELAVEAIPSVLVMLAFTDPNDPMPGKPIAKAELETKRKNHRAATDLVRAMLKPYGLDGLIGKAPMSPETTKTIESAVDKADTVAMITSFFGTVEKIGPMLGLTKTTKPKAPFELGNVTNYSIKGDRATARSGADTLEFVRVEGRWYVIPPKSAGK